MYKDSGLSTLPQQIWTSDLSLSAFILERLWVSSVDIQREDKTTNTKEKTSLREPPKSEYKTLNW
jgi:hypothetical protein